MNFMFDIETVGIESTCGILSAAIIYFDLEEELSMDILRERALFVKFNIKEQIESLGRTTTKSTLDWWMSQPDHIKNKSLPRMSSDVSARDGIVMLRDYILENGPDIKKNTLWARGTLDQPAIDSLCRSVGEELIAPYYVWRDVRTAIDIIYNSTNGYCKVSSIPYDAVKKHDPVDDCAFDIMMLCRGD